MAHMGSGTRRSTMPCCIAEILTNEGGNLSGVSYVRGCVVYHTAIPRETGFFHLPLCCVRLHRDDP